jgi:hypothetical protein
MTDKLYHSIFKKIPEDVSAPYRKAVKQVQTVLFNELTWGMPSRLKRDFKGSALMVLNGVVWIGASMMLMGFIRDEDKDGLKEADAETKIRRFASYLFGSQGFFGGIPIFGTILGGLVENMIPGEKKFQNFGNALAPITDDVTRLIKDLSQDPEWGIVIMDIAKIGMMYYGAGRGLFNDIEAAIEMGEAKGAVRGFLRLFGVR